MNSVHVGTTVVAKLLDSTDQFIDLCRYMNTWAEIDEIKYFFQQ
jgi:hypothetical protein